MVFLRTVFDFVSTPPGRAAVAGSTAPRTHPPRHRRTAGRVPPTLADYTFVVKPYDVPACNDASTTGALATGSVVSSFVLCCVFRACFVCVYVYVCVIIAPPPPTRCSLKFVRAHTSTRVALTVPFLSVLVRQRPIFLTTRRPPRALTVHTFRDPIAPYPWQYLFVGPDPEHHHEKTVEHFISRTRFCHSNVGRRLCSIWLKGTYAILPPHHDIALIKVHLGNYTAFIYPIR